MSKCPAGTTSDELPPLNRFGCQTTSAQRMSATQRPALATPNETPGRQDRRRRRRPGGLTPREIEVLQHVATGATNPTVAATLWVSDQTVKFHLGNVYRKLGVSNRFEASRWALENGLLDVQNTHEQTTSRPLTVAHGT